MFVTKKLSLLARFEVAIAIAVVLASAWRRKWHTDFVRMCRRRASEVREVLTLPQTNSFIRMFEKGHSVSEIQISVNATMVGVSLMVRGL